MKMFEEKSRVEEDAMKMSDLGGSMSEATELKMDENYSLEERRIC
jgi:hypothetical protein